MLMACADNQRAFFDVQVRVRDDFNVEMHIDTDDANSAGIKNGDLVKILEK